MDRLKLPSVGLRMVKSAIVVFLSLAISLLRGDAGIPFYVAIAAVLCIQPSMGSSKEAGFGRLFGTLLGGFWGSIGLGVNLYVIKDAHILIHYLFISAMIIPVIYTAVAFKKPSAVFISCVVFLSITISHIGDITPFMFIVNRMFDTFLGVLIAMPVNMIGLPSEKE